MSKNHAFNSDYDAFKNSGAIKTASVTMSGTLGAGARLSKSTTPLAVTSPDFAQFLFDNSQKHSGKFKRITLEQVTMIYESTNLSELTCGLGVVVQNGQVYFTAEMFNPYSVSVNLQSTTINFRYIPYEATF